MTLTEASRAYGAAAHLLVCSDFDGTLTPIQDRPDAVELSGSMRRLLWNLSQLSETNLVVASGRSLTDIRQQVGLPGLWYLGNHGLEIGGPGVDYVHPEAQQAQPDLERWVNAIRERLVAVPGVYLEDKALTASVHFRQVKPEHRPGIKDLLEETKPDGFVVTPGKMVWELRPIVDWHKGRGIAWLAERVPSCRVIFLGDDRTDEDAFRTLGADALSIKVGPGPTAARYRLAGVDEVAHWLNDLLEHRRQHKRLQALSQCSERSVKLS